MGLLFVVLCLLELMTLGLSKKMLPQPDHLVANTPKEPFLERNLS